LRNNSALVGGAAQGGVQNEPVHPLCLMLITQRLELMF